MHILNRIKISEHLEYGQCDTMLQDASIQLNQQLLATITKSITAPVQIQYYRATLLLLRYSLKKFDLGI